MTAAQMGTLAWAEGSGGRLTEKEKIKLARNVAALRAETLFDEFRHRLGLLKPEKIDIGLLAPPDTQLVRDADALAREVYDDVLWAHCARTYYFGALIASFDKIKFDREIFYAAAICHDVGVNEDAAGAVSCCCFAHSGGRLAFQRLSGAGHSHVAQQIGDAISTHMNLLVLPDEYPAESTLVAVGATCDVIGSYVRRIEKSTLAAVVERWPRTGVLDAFGNFLTKKHLDDSRTATLMEMGAFGGSDIHPIEAALTGI